MIHDHKLIKSQEVHQLVLPDKPVISKQRGMKNYFVSQATSNIVYLLPLGSHSYLVACLSPDAPNLRGCSVDRKELNNIIRLLPECNSFNDLLDKGQHIISARELQVLNIDGWWQDVLYRYKNHQNDKFYYIDYTKGKVKVLSELEL